jgi:hypothetical protein
VRKKTDHGKFLMEEKCPVEKALEQNAAPIEAWEGGSRWARLSAEIADGSMSLGEEAAARFEQDRKDFQEQFQFKLDDEDE